MLRNGWEYREAFDEAMKIYLAGVESRHWIQEGYADLSCRIRKHGEYSTVPKNSAGNVGGDSMSENIPRQHPENSFGSNQQEAAAIPERERECDCFLQGSPHGGRGGYDPIILQHRPYILESFYYADADTERLLPYYGDFLLDSGAFTFIQNKAGSVNWNEYLEEYANFINRNKVDKFFELDIDSVVGYRKVLEFRTRLEKLTNKQCIPVWHKSRGATEYKRHCEEYPYVAIGGYVIKELQPNDFAAFPTMIRIAHQNKAKVHCLGFTKLNDLPKYHFDSVDSTAWTTGNRFGYLYEFNGKTMVKHDKPIDHRLADSRQVALHNYTEWIKFQKYAERNL